MRSSSWVLTYTWLTYTPTIHNFGKFVYNIWNSMTYTSRYQEGYQMPKSCIEWKEVFKQVNRHIIKVNERNEVF